MGKLSKKKSGWKPLEIPIVIPNDKAPKTETMDYKESFKYTSWAMERELADKIMKNLKKRFPASLDSLMSFSQFALIQRLSAKMWQRLPSRSTSTITPRLAESMVQHVVSTTLNHHHQKQSSVPLTRRTRE